jgi:hypothetical protein
VWPRLRLCTELSLSLIRVTFSCLKDEQTFRFKASASIFGFKRSKFVFGGIIPFSRTRIVLMRPAIPLAPSRCPMFDFTAPLYFCSQTESARIKISDVLHIERLIRATITFECPADGIGLYRITYWCARAYK